MPRRIIALRTLLALLLSGTSLLACGGTEPDEPTDEELCAASDGASWSGDGCGGTSDRCDSNVCETVNGEGCHCDAPGMCWDGSACVEGPSMANAHEPSPS